MPSMKAQITPRPKNTVSQQLGDPDPGVAGVEPADADGQEELQQPGDHLGAVRVREPADRVAAVRRLRVVAAVRDEVAADERVRSGVGVRTGVGSRRESGRIPARRVLPDPGQPGRVVGRSGTGAVGNWVRRVLAGRGRQVVEQAVQLGRGTRGVGRGHPLLELRRLQPALREVLAERLDRLLPLGGADAYRSRIGCRHAPDVTAAGRGPTGCPHAGPWLRSAPCASDSSCPRAGGSTSSASTPRSSGR